MKRSLAGLAVGLLLCLSGCGRAADPPAEAEPTPSVSTTTTSPPKTLSPEETVRAWVRAFNTLTSSGNGQPLIDLTASNCKTCGQVTGGVEATISRGGRYRGGDWLVRRTHVEKASGHGTVVNAAIEARAGAVRNGPTGPYKAFGADRLLLEFTVTMEAGSLRVADVVWVQ